MTYIYIYIYIYISAHTLTSFGLNFPGSCLGVGGSSPLQTKACIKSKPYN